MENILNYSKTVAAESLYSLVNDWINSKESRSVSLLARESGVNESSVRRIITSKIIPSTDNLHKIISYIRSGSSHKALLESLSPELQKHLRFELTYLQFEEFEKYVSMTDKENLLPDFVHQTIFERSSIGDGLFENEIVEMFGNFGRVALDNLIVNNLVSSKEGLVVVNPLYKKHSWSTDLYKNFLSKAIENFYKTETQNNYLFCMNEGVSIKGYCDVMDVLESASNNILKIIETNPGKIPLSVGGFMDTLTYKNVFLKQEDLK